MTDQFVEYAQGAWANHFHGVDEFYTALCARKMSREVPQNILELWCEVLSYSDEQRAERFGG